VSPPLGTPLQPGGEAPVPVPTPTPIPTPVPTPVPTVPPTTAPTPVPTVAPTPPPVVTPPAVPSAPSADETPVPASPRAKATLSRADEARAELRLLRQARAAVVREDYAAALPPIAEHARRFKDGRLTEEREALKVKALAGLGRTDEARRAAASFRARFPRSVLLPAISQMSTAAP